MGCICCFLYHNIKRRGPKGSRSGMNEKKDMESVLCHLLVALSHLQHLRDSVALSVITFKNMS